MIACSCHDWKDNIDKVNGPIELQAIRLGTKGYDGVVFRFCPWCGQPLSDNIKCDTTLEPNNA